MGVHLASALKIPKHFEKLLLILQGNTYPRVFDRYQYGLLVPELDLYIYTAFWLCELEGI